MQMATLEPVKSVSLGRFKQKPPADCIWQNRQVVARWHDSIHWGSRQLLCYLLCLSNGYQAGSLFVAFFVQQYCARKMDARILQWHKQPVVVAWKEALKTCPVWIYSCMMKDIVRHIPRPTPEAELDGSQKFPCSLPAVIPMDRRLDATPMLACLRSCRDMVCRLAGLSPPDQIIAGLPL